MDFAEEELACGLAFRRAVEHYKHAPHREIAGDSAAIEPRSGKDVDRAAQSCNAVFIDRNCGRSH
jgi:hypothetical protein